MSKSEQKCNFANVQLRAMVVGEGCEKLNRGGCAETNRDRPPRRGGRGDEYSGLCGAPVLEGGDLVLVLQSHGDVVQAVEQAVAAEVVDLELHEEYFVI